MPCFKSPIFADVSITGRPYLKSNSFALDWARKSIVIPISVAKNGKGPTVLFTGANHGDEYEGPVALFDLANHINAEEISGRVIIIPGMNYPAFKAGKRTSPIDGGNMNRVFPGNPEGTFTEKIADYFNRTLLPMADYVVDFHSGGKTLDFLPFCCAHVLDDKKQQRSLEPKEKLDLETTLSKSLSDSYGGSIKTKIFSFLLIICFVKS